MEIDNNFYYNPTLKIFSRKHRNQSTKAEIRLWCELLRNRKMMGFSFLRQRPIGNFIADFFCKELKLIIETDGESHEYDETIIKDRNKDKFLNKIGYTVIRFTDHEVMDDIELVGWKIKNWILKNFPNIKDNR